MMEKVAISVFLIWITISTCIAQHSFEYTSELHEKGKNVTLRFRILKQDTVEWTTLYILLGDTPAQSNILNERIDLKTFVHRKNFKVNKHLKVQRHGSVINGQISLRRQQLPYLSLYIRRLSGEIMQGDAL